MFMSGEVNVEDKDDDDGEDEVEGFIFSTLRQAGRENLESSQTF